MTILRDGKEIELTYNEMVFAAREVARHDAKEDLIVACRELFNEDFNCFSEDTRDIAIGLYIKYNKRSLEGDEWWDNAREALAIAINGGGI